MSIGKNIRALRERSGLSQADFAKMLGVTDKAVSTWENETRIPRMGVIQKIADSFGIQKTDIIEDGQLMSLPGNVVPLQKMKKVPLLGIIACGTPILAEENITDYIDLPGHIRADYALQCRGESMINAGIRDGDIVYIRRQEAVDNGKIAAVLVEGVETEATLKRFYLVDGTVTLTAENPAVLPMVFVGPDAAKIRVIGKAVAYTHVIE